MKPALVISTYPDRRSINRIAGQLVRSGAAACVNISRVSSVYSWKGRIENAHEYIALFKTTQKNKRRLKEEIKKTHPYDVPEIAEIHVSSINAPYLAWLADPAS